MAEKGAIAVREYGCHPPGPKARLCVSHGIHAAVNGVQPPQSDSIVDGPKPDPKRRELPPCDDAVLALCKGCQLSFTL